MNKYYLNYYVSKARLIRGRMAMLLDYNGGIRGAVTGGEEAAATAFRRRRRRLPPRRPIVVFAVVR